MPLFDWLCICTRPSSLPFSSLQLDRSSLPFVPSPSSFPFPSLLFMVLQPFSSSLHPSFIHSFTTAIFHISNGIFILANADFDKHLLSNQKLVINIKFIAVSLKIISWRVTDSPLHWFTPSPLFIYRFLRSQKWRNLSFPYGSASYKIT